MLRPRLPRIGRALKTQHRSLHKVPLLTHDFSNGVPGLLSPAGFNMAWTQYQSLMVEKLNTLTVGGPDEYLDTKKILTKYARDPTAAPLFNYASMAHNNNFFFSCLSPHTVLMPSALQNELEGSFSSIETLRREFILTASSMFGPGFVWLVKAKDGNKGYTLLSTYIAGSPYPEAHHRRQPLDMNTEHSDRSISDYQRRMTSGLPTNKVGSHGPLSNDQRVPPGGVELTPLLCINTWEHVYLADYGVGAGGVGGKKAFAEAWWSAINWEVVADRAGATGASKFKT